MYIVFNKFDFVWCKKQKTSRIGIFSGVSNETESAYSVCLKQVKSFHFVDIGLSLCRIVCNGEEASTVNGAISSDAGELGDSYGVARQTFRSTEAKFKRRGSFGEKYIDFMENLIRKEIILLSQVSTIPNRIIFCLTIQPPNRSFRVVFNGSSVTSSGESYNSLQMIGENLQDNLFDILLRFRLHRVALTGDVAQMYPQVVLKHEFRQLQ